MPREYYTSQKIAFAQVDLGCAADFEQLPKERVEAVVICSAHLPANVQEYDPQHYININVTGTVNVMEYCRRVRAGKVILASSHSDVAQLWNIGRPITEEDQRASSTPAITPCIHYEKSRLRKLLNITKSNMVFQA